MQNKQMQSDNKLFEFPDLNIRNMFNELPDLNVDNKESIYGHIYMATCLTTHLQYVGQALSHHLNHKKYRFHGYKGRWNAHVSEAIKNTRKKKACRYLNNAIRKYGKDDFIVELIATCEKDEMDDLERHYIEKYNTLAPDGYNLTKGGKGNIAWVNPKLEVDDTGTNTSLKRGREFGYTHKKVTISKMKKYYTNITKEAFKKKKDTMRNSISKHFNDKRAERLANSGIEFGPDFAKHIRERRKDGEDDVIGYIIRINRRPLGEITNLEMTLEEKYNLLYNALEKAYVIQQERKLIKEQEDNKTS